MAGSDMDVQLLEAAKAGDLETVQVVYSNVNIIRYYRAINESNSWI